MTNDQRQQQGMPGQGGSSPLSLLVNAVDSRDGAGRGAPAAAAAAPGSFQDRALAESVLRRGLGGGGGGESGVGPLHEELMRQKQAESLRQAALHAQQPNASAGLLQQLSESQQFSQQLSQQLSQSDIRSALASAQLRQAPQLSNADLMALARSGALPGLGGLLGGGALSGLTGGAGAGGFDPRMGDLQGLEELERRQRLLAGLPPQLMPGQQSQASEASSEPSPAAPAGASGGNGQDSALMGMVRSAEGAGPGSRPQPAAAAAAAAAGGGEKKDQRRDPGSVVVPCRARGMPMDHNFKTAYFVIPENVRHGEELICSYFACRNAGVKFRYCSHCKVPVAKRNFRKRHRHGDNDKSRIVDDDDDSEEGSRGGNNGDADMDDIPSQVTTKIPTQESKMPAKVAPKASSMEEIIRSQQLSAQQQLAAQQMNAQLGARQQLNAQHPGASLQQQQQNALQQLNAQQQSALQQHLSAQQQALQQHLGAQNGFQQQLGGQQEQQLSAQARAQLGGLGSMSAQAAAAGMQLGGDRKSVV